MAHFAELDNNNIVLRVLVINDYDCLDSEGKESEEVGRNFCISTWGGRWIQTSYNNKIRKRYAGIGFVYDEEHDVFLYPKPFDSWVLDIPTLEWIAPVPMPEEDPGDRMFYSWDEPTLKWIIET